MPKLQLASRLEKIPGIGVDVMADAADATHDPDILRLENLDTDLPPPKEALKVTKEGIEKDQNNSYLPFLGQENLRKAVVKRIHSACKETYHWQTECLITAGGMSGILNCFLALIEPGDEVIVTDPVYAGILNRIRLAGGIPVFVPLIPSKTGWSLDTAALKRAVSSKTKMLVISPGMPSGHVLTQQEWEAVATVAHQHDLWVLYDAAMEQILYDGRQVLHPVMFPHMRERTIAVGAASKELRMIGWRVGWVVGPESIMKAIGLVSISNVVCQTGISMEGVAAGLNAVDNGLKNAVAIWEERKNTLLSALSDFPVIPPHGGWSLLLDASALNMSAPALSQKLFREAKIATTPMSGWGEQAAKYVRFVFSNEPKERLELVRTRLQQIF